MAKLSSFIILFVLVAAGAFVTFGIPSIVGLVTKSSSIQANEVLFSKAQKLNINEKLVAELDRTFTTRNFGSIKTMKKFDKKSGYPVDFVREKLFQKQLTFFLVGDYANANAVHLRILKGLMGMSKNTVRKVDFALAHFYYNIFNNPQLNQPEIQRAAIRGTLLPALSVMDQLRWTRVSLTGRMMNRNYKDASRKQSKASGKFVNIPQVSIPTFNPFKSATRNWPIEAALPVINVETGTVDFIATRSALQVEGTDIRIPRSRFQNQVEGAVNYFIDESLQGRGDCSLLEASKNDFSCPNKFLCTQTDQPERAGETASQLTDQANQITQGLSLDPLTPNNEIPSLETMLINTCDVSSSIEDAGGMSPFNRKGVCGRSGQSQAKLLAECIKETNERQKLRLAVQREYGIVDFGCTETESDENENNDDTEADKYGNENLRDCEGAECEDAGEAGDRVAERWEDERQERGEALKEACSPACSDADVQGAIDTTINELRDSANFGVMENAIPTTASTGPNPSGGLADLGEGGFVIFVSDYLLGGGTITRETGESFNIDGTVDHESWHIALEVLGVPSDNDETDEDVAGRDHDTISKWSGRTGSGIHNTGPDFIAPGNSCSNADAQLSEYYQCKSMSGPSEDGKVEPDPLAPYIQPDPNENPATPAIPTLPCLAGVIKPESQPIRITKAGPDCNFGDAECCQTDTSGRCVYGGAQIQQARPGCGTRETPQSPEQCSQPLCPEGEVPVPTNRGIQCTDEPPALCASPPCNE